ncbi:serine/threonine-protein kinase ATG1c-like isoform X2 [Magnolia sinica]|uniref:serine/threonine-protein kinase ATG1c-like isoform X2 n=1 Tax=Magnolia sinica TaxID=86752 RepID=UPI002657CCC1|nr:serine/threonine-protein kinase ATG1c-like isoform X2 [Magnolia sinica]
MYPTMTGGSRVLGDYIVGRQIGSGSFSIVWHGRHRIDGTEVAIKEIVMERLNAKLRDSLLSEIRILKNIDHPNIIRLHDIIENSGKIHLVLEYCRGGDLSMYIQRRGSVPEVSAKYFMQQLAAGLQVLRENNLIHRDLKPQNLLLATNDDHSLLKIADFGFARSLQPRGLAETLCGSPLYMAPEIMQLQKYDAKADLWSVGAILFQLVTGKTPFSGNNQIQLLQNIVKSNELQFPSDKSNLSSDCLDLCQKLLRRNPVERLTFEEFFNHRFLSQDPVDQSLSSRTTSRARDCFPLGECNLARQTEESSQEDCLPFLLDDDSSGPDGSPSMPSKRNPMKPTCGFSVDKDGYRKGTSNTSNNMDITSRNSFTHKPDKTISRHGFRRPSDGYLKEVAKAPMKVSSKVVDSLELIDQDYVIVSGPSVEASSSSASASRLRHSPCKSEGSPMTSINNNMLSRPMPIAGAAAKNTSGFGSLGSHSSAPSGTSQGSTDMGDAFEQPSTDGMTRIRSLQQCASAITELVNEKTESEKRLEAFSIQLVILAIWKQALHICHTQAASAMEESPSQEIAVRGSSNKKHNPDAQEFHNSGGSEGTAAICSQIEREFLVEVAHAEELARDLGLTDGNVEMPDAIESIYQSALAFGRHAAVDELMGDMDNAVTLYSKAVRLLFFLVVEAPSLILNPPFSLTNSDRYRLRSYIDFLNNRQSHSASQRLALLKCEDQQSP